MANFIAAAVVLLIVGAAAAYVIKAKKSGVKCIGCPDSKTCSSGGCSGSCSSCPSCGGKK